MKMKLMKNKKYLQQKFHERYLYPQITADFTLRVSKCYCKRGYFRWGKISRKCWQDISHGGNFHDSTPYFLHKGIWVLLSRGGNFREEDKSAKNAKITPTRKFPRLQYVPFTC